MKTAINSRALDWFFGGVERAQVTGRPAVEVCSCAASLTNVRAVADGACHVVNLHGQDVQVVASKIFDEAGRHAKTVMLFTDITQQMENERHLQLYAKVFSHVGEGILITDADNRIIEVNAAVTRITGYEREALIGTTPDILKTGLDESPFSQELWRTLRQTGHWHGEIVDRSRDARSQLLGSRLGSSRLLFQPACADRPEADGWLRLHSSRALPAGLDRLWRLVCPPGAMV